ncbi:hypothetical protein QBC46DRAFT_242577, partial [Diplogelasinospora grovesii]
SHKAPSAGQKVQLGENAPITREGAGPVPDESLAAESIKSGGAFSENRGAIPGSGPQRDPGAGAPYTRGEPPKDLRSRDESQGGSGDALENQKSYAGPAPTYVLSREFMKDKKGPHGKNLKEGGFEGSGTDGGPLPEPGSMEDPARLAELNLIA